MAVDDVSKKLAAGAAVADPRILQAFARHQHRTLSDLHEELAACERRFRAWVEDPANAGRPISEAPDHLDRIAVDALIERRLFAE